LDRRKRCQKNGTSKRSFKCLKMNLTKEQLATIKAFIIKKGINYLDVQMEILDHVASAVEEKMTANNSLSFEEALKQTHASFGIFGFGGVEDAIVNGMSKKYNRIFWNYFLSFFGFKYILLVFLSAFLIYEAQVLVEDYFQFLAYFLFIVIVAVAAGFVFVLKHNSYRKLLVYKRTGSYLSFFGSGFIVYNYLIGNLRYFELINTQQIHILSSIMLLVFLIYIITAFKMAFLGIKESKLIMQKYQLLEN